VSGDNSFCPLILNLRASYFVHELDFITESEPRANN
jgi:hypothetical protein